MGLPIAEMTRAFTEGGRPSTEGDETSPGRRVKASRELIGNL